MGTWGEGTFQNDAALDWLSEVESRGAEAVRAALRRAATTPGDGYLDCDEGASAVAAAELVAAASGHGEEELPARALAWLDAGATAFGAEDLALARRAVDRVVAPNSELAALWAEHGPENGWLLRVRALRSRLPEGAAAAVAPDKDPHLQLKQALVTFLSMRGLHPTGEEMATIEASRDGAEVRRWLERVVDAASVAAVFDATESS
ncbi:MAG: DUF4259 domain-containing protein [Polyangiales bacterium]